jgi:hypothetical protein
MHVGLFVLSALILCLGVVLQFLNRQQDDDFPETDSAVDSEQPKE